VAKLTPPAEDKAAFARYMTADKRIDGLRVRFATAIRAKDNTEMTSLSDLVDTETKARTEAALDLGTIHCGA
jgi:hypothetical protein